VTKQWTADIIVMPKEGVNDPEGEAILGGLHDLGYRSVSRVRSGKRFVVELTASDEAGAREQAVSMADRLLANPVIESFEVAQVISDS
jgi:phosphoribosylformylglycinamidine synthase subunit PurS